MPGFLSAPNAAAGGADGRRGSSRSNPPSKDAVRQPSRNSANPAAGTEAVKSDRQEQRRDKDARKGAKHYGLTGADSSALSDDPQLIKELTEKAKLRLQKVMEVNRQLHNALIEKKLLTEELRKQNTALSSRIECGSKAELPARISRVAELEQTIQKEQRKQQTDSLDLGRDIMEREERVGELTAVNAQLREAGLRNRSEIKEMQVKLKERQGEVRDMERHIQIMEGCETPPLKEQSVSFMSLDSGDDESTDGRENGSTRDEKQVGVFGGLKPIEEYNDYPGLDIDVLLGNKPPSPKGRKFMKNARRTQSHLEKRDGSLAGHTPSNRTKSTGRLEG